MSDDQHWVAPTIAVALGIAHIINQWCIARYNKKKEATISNVSTAQRNSHQTHEAQSIGSRLLSIVCFIVSVLMLLWLLSWRSPITRLEVVETALLAMFAFRFLLWIVTPPI
jgi:hypothetical protein